MKKKTIGIFVVGMMLSLCGAATGQQDTPADRLGLTRLVIARRQVVFGGASFGSAGQYELLTGTAYGELDPHAPGNAGIVNVNNAPLNAKGHVEYNVDIAILKPVDTAKGNGRLLYDVVNRGKNTALNHLNDSGDTFTASDTGNGFLMKRGYTVVWSGWQADIPSNSSLLKANLPVATRDGKPLVGTSGRSRRTCVYADIDLPRCFTRSFRRHTHGA